MDPYLEQRWGDFHTRFVTYLADALQPGLPQELRARMEERVFVESLDAPGRQYVPDVHVYERPKVSDERLTATAVADAPAAAQPFIMTLPLEITERFIEIVDVRSGGRIITIIEMLSPSNKLSGRGRVEYLRKQQEALDARVNLVELDLLRIGDHTTLARPALVPPDLLTPYHASIYRATANDRLEYYRISLRERLPRLPIPLRPTDNDIVLDLQAILDQAYDRGRYDDIDYARPLSMPLNPADLAWADEILKPAR